MMQDRQVILVGGVGDLGKYACEELFASEHFDVAVLSRTVGPLGDLFVLIRYFVIGFGWSLIAYGSTQAEHKWCAQRSIPVYPTDYTAESLKWIFNLAHATTVISFINLVGSGYVDVHANLLAACRQSDTCKRIIPSEWIGDSETFPSKPDYYAKSRGPFRQMLRSQEEVEWTLFNVGWIADYLLPEEKTYISPVPGKFPIDRKPWSACIRNTGDEPQSWTCGREIGKAVVELCKASSWVRTDFWYPSFQALP